MTNKELLEQAAKAAGIDLAWMSGIGSMDFDTGHDWNPLTDDGDALRLAVKLRLDVLVLSDVTEVPIVDGSVRELHNDDPYAATRRAIVRAAAEIGKNK